MRCSQLNHKRSSRNAVQRQRRGLFRRFLVLLVVGLLSCMLFGMTFASETPARAAANEPSSQGYVTDNAHMFTTVQKQQLVKASKAARYHFYILTINSFGGRQPEQYAAKIFKDWRLSNQDVLAVLSEQEKHIQLEYHNPTLEQAINSQSYRSSSGSPLDQFVAQYFIPYAQQGNISNGLVHLIKAASSLKAKGGAGSAHHTGLWVLLFVILIAAAVGLLVWLIRRIQQRKRLLLQKQNNSERVQQLRRQLSDIQEALEPYVEFSTGKTKTLVQENGQSVSSLMITSGERHQQLEQTSASIVRLRTVRRILQDTDAFLKDADTQVNALQAEADRLKAAENEVKSGLSSAEQELQNLQHELERYQHANGYEAMVMAQQVNGVQQGVKEVSEQRVFDPVGAVKLLDGLHAYIRKTAEDLTKLQVMKQFLDTLPEEIRRTREQIKRCIDSEDLPLDPQAACAPLNQAEQEESKLEEALRTGDVEQAEVLQQAMHERMQDALQQVQNIQHWKHQNEEELRRIRAFQEQLESTYSQAENVLERLKASYVRKHADQAADQLQQLKQVASKLLECSAPAFVLQQQKEYEDARGTLVRAMELFREAEQLASFCLHADSQYEERKSKLRNEVMDVWSGYHRARTEMEVEKLPESETLREHIRALVQQHEKLENAFAKAPFDLDELEYGKKQLASDIENFQHSVKKLAEEKRQAEEKLEEIRQQYDYRYNRYGSRLGDTIYTTHYNSTMDSVMRMFELGLFMDALSEMNTFHTDYYDDDLFHQNFGMDAWNAGDDGWDTGGDSGFDSGGGDWGDSSGGGDWGGGDDGGGDW